MATKVPRTSVKNSVSPPAKSSFNSSTLVRLLAELTTADVAGSKQSLAERLGLWLGWADAISLSAALNGHSARPPDTPAGMPLDAHAAAGQVARVRAGLARAIAAEGMFKAGKASVKRPPPAPGAAIDDAVDFSPYRRCYAAHQRAMDASISPLRAQVRTALEGLSPALGRLAALDAALDKILSERERSLLSSVPGLLEKRFERLHKAHQQALADPRAPDSPDPGRQPAGWLAVYCKDMQGVLLAELEIRLQPVEGLVDAMR